MYAAVAAELGITGETLRTWVRKDNTGQQAPVTRNGSGPESPTEELVQLRDENARMPRGDKESSQCGAESAAAGTDRALSALAFLFHFRTGHSYMRGCLFVGRGARTGRTRGGSSGGAPLGLRQRLPTAGPREGGHPLQVGDDRGRQARRGWAPGPVPGGWGEDAARAGG
ncbi:hypothetical protein ACWD26_20020 [Streptomyces sp. NPDC002787]